MFGVRHREALDDAETFVAETIEIADAEAALMVELQVGVSTTSVLPSQCPRESPVHCWMPPRQTWPVVERDDAVRRDSSPPGS